MVRELAITFDDLPAGSGVISHDVTALTAMTKRLIGRITAHRVPVVGFVNEGDLNRGNELEPRIAVLRLWVDAGLELGNHTYSHRSLQLISAQAFAADVIRGERITSTLLQERGMTLRYFRHPFLHMGSDLSTRRVVEQFLVDRGYTICPVTIYPQDWAFASVYANAARRGEEVKMRRVIDRYLAHAERALAWSEAASADLLGYEVKQVLLLHANLLNADCFDELAALWQRRRYRVIGLEEALCDPAYAQVDTFVGPYTASWLYHWAKTQGRTIGKGPRLPASIVTGLYASSRGGWIRAGVHLLLRGPKGRGRPRGSRRTTVVRAVLSRISKMFRLWPDTE